MGLIDRPLYMRQLENYVGTPVVKVLVGMRRSGKSALLEMLKPRLSALRRGPIIHLNFDLMSNDALRDPHALDQYIRNHTPGDAHFTLLLDEVQEVAQWEKVVNSLVAEGRADIYITGSNSGLLSSELATYIAGRYVSIKVQPLSFAEFVAFSRETGQDDDVDVLFNRFLIRGGLPGLFAAPYSDQQARQLVSDVFDSTLLRDIITRRNVRSPELYGRVASYALDNVGNLFSARRVSEFLRSESKSVSHQTVADYLSTMTDAYLLEKVTRFDLRGRTHLATQEKYYAGDHGLVNALLGYSITRLPGLLENIVHGELKSRGYRDYVGRLGETEVDFVAQRHGEQIYVQISASILDSTTREREYAPLLAIRDSFPKYVLTLDPVVSGPIQGVQHRHLPDFLLDTTWG